jgi:hypothetical protein
VTFDLSRKAIFADSFALQCAMSENPIALRRKAEACRQLADVDQSAERKALWLKRADQWEQLAIEAEKHPPKSTEA